MWISTPRP